MSTHTKLLHPVTVSTNYYHGLWFNPLPPDSDILSSLGLAAATYLSLYPVVLIFPFLLISYKVASYIGMCSNICGQAGQRSLSSYQLVKTTLQPLAMMLSIGW